MYYLVRSHLLPVFLFYSNVLYSTVPIKLCETPIYCNCLNWCVPMFNLYRNEINSSLWFKIKIRSVRLFVWRQHVMTGALHKEKSFPAPQRIINLVWLVQIDESLQRPCLGIHTVCDASVHAVKGTKPRHRMFSLCMHLFVTSFCETRSCAYFWLHAFCYTCNVCHTDTCMQAHTYTVAHTLTVTLTCTHTLTLICTHTLTVTLTSTHTHRHARAHAHTHTQS